MKNFKRLAVLGTATAAFLGASLAIASPAHAQGTSAISGATVYSDSTVTTAKGSSAVVSLGKLGRVELRAGNSVKQIAAGNQDTAG
ncbi:MAG: hypothetical protein QOF21_1156 [Actinomycetota bacterium]